MARTSIDSRRQKYYKLSSQFALLDSTQLTALLGSSGQAKGWGTNQTVEVAGSKVFVKRVPVTDAEYNNLFSTKNLYDLPTCYNYGVGSAGFGVFRELVTHIKTTNWVLQGAIANFPLMYHYRIVPFSGTRADIDMEQHQKYVNYWGDNANIGRYMLERANANYELVLCLEHIPYVLQPWLAEHPNKVEHVLEELRATLSFLRKHHIIHFDAHFFNILSDGEQIYLTDFGLVLDKAFALTQDETSFFNANTHYDYGEVLSCLGFLVTSAYEALPDNHRRQIMGKHGIKEGIPRRELLPVLLNNIEQIHSDGTMKMGALYVASLIKYRSIIVLMNDFYADLQANHKKDTKFRHAELKRLLKQTGFLPSSSS
jgi:hypothetical protein